MTTWRWHFWPKIPTYCSIYESHSPPTNQQQNHQRSSIGVQHFVWIKRPFNSCFFFFWTGWTKTKQNQTQLWQGSHIGGNSKFGRRHSPWPETEFSQPELFAQTHTCPTRNTYNQNTLKTMHRRRHSHTHTTTQPLTRHVQIRTPEQQGDMEVDSQIQQHKLHRVSGAMTVSTTQHAGSNDVMQLRRYSRDVTTRAWARMRQSYVL